MSLTRYLVKQSLWRNQSRSFLSSMRCPTPKAFLLRKLAPEAVHQLTIQTALSLGYLQEPGALASVELQLSLHAAAPKIQAFYQFYEDQHLDSAEDGCGSWVDWYGERICDIETLAEVSGHETIDALPFNNTESYVPAFRRRTRSANN